MEAGISGDQTAPAIGKHSLLASRDAISARQVLFVGVPPLSAFGYREIRNFSATVLEILATEAPQTRHLAMTIRGANFGLDEIECAEQQLRGYQDALREGRYPKALRSISIAELDQDRVEALTALLERLRYSVPLHMLERL
jgi:hypothetical protein